jgi:hypothetical protein
MNFEPGDLLLYDFCQDAGGGSTCWAAHKSECCTLGRKSINAELNMLGRLNAEFFASKGDIGSTDCSGKVGGLEFLSHALGGEPINARWPHLAHGHNEAGKFVNRKEVLGHRRLARHAAIRGVAKNRIQDLIINIASLTEPLHTYEWMLRLRWVFFVVKVMK